MVEQIIPKFGEYGGAVVVAHPDGTANLYGHVYDYVVKPGQKIEKGDPLAKIIFVALTSANLDFDNSISSVITRQ